MGINKVNYGSTTLIDISNDTVTAGSMISGTTAHDNSGAAITGTIASKSSSDLTASGATVTVPAGYYASSASKSVTSGSATPATSLSASSGVGVGTVIGSSGKLLLSKSISNTPVVTAGYISAGTAGNTSIELSITTNVIDTATITPTTSDQTIPSGTYCAGAQTIKGDANLVAANIASGITIFGVSGSHSGGATIRTATKENSTNTATSLAFTGLSKSPKAFALRLNTAMSRNSNSSYYYITTMVYDGSHTYGNYWRMSTGNYYTDTTHYSFTYSSGTLTVKTSASRTSAGGCFYGGTYELVYAY